MQEPIDPQSNPAYQLWLATNAWQRQVRKALSPLDLTFVQFTVLASISKLSMPVCQADICRFGSLDPNMASTVVRSMELKDLIRRAPHPSDRRARALVLTPKGEGLLRQARTLIRPVSESFFAPLGEERADLVRLLRLLSEHE